jgi:hypothetical protein
VTFATDLEVPARYQSEPSSAPSQAFNCGVTVAVAIADFYIDRKHAIEPARRLIDALGPYHLGAPWGSVLGAPEKKPTNSHQQADILRALGVPCTVVQFKSVAQLHSIVDSGRRPVLLGLDFTHVENATSGYATKFNGWHAIKVRAGMTRNGVRGFAINDPNFWPGTKDTTAGMRFYSDAAMQHALDAADEVCKGVAPDVAKTHPAATEDHEMAILSRIRVEMVPRNFAVRKGVTLHKGPGFHYPLHWTVPQEESFRLIGWDIDPTTKRETQWVLASRPGGTGFFFVPPDHSPK